MAEQVQPRHMPHEQLRTEAPAQKDHSDKYVSAFVSGDSFTEMSFRNPVLQASADHFKVGIDELTVNLGNLSMLEYEEGKVLFRVIRRGYTEGAGANETQVSFQMPDAPVSAELIAQLAAANALDPNVVGAAVKQAAIDAAQAEIVLARAFYRDGFEFKIDRPFLTFHEITSRMEEVAETVGYFVRQNGYDNAQFAGVTWNIARAQQQAAVVEHFEITTTTNGQGGEGGQQVVESLPRTLITLSVSQVQMQRVLLGQQQGELSFALLTEDSKVTLAPPTTTDSLFQ